MLHPRYKRYFKQILSFGFIWLFFALIYALLEMGLLGNLTKYPSTGNTYNWQNSLTYASVGSFFMGLVQGTIEVAWLKKRLARSPFWKKILVKSMFYLLLTIFFLVTLTLIANANYLKAPIFDPIVIDSVVVFIKKFSFWSIILYVGFVVDVALFYSEIEGYLGNGILYNYSFGKYHKPKQETRIFMFLDMKSSTAIAERIGHKRYFNLIKAYYADMTDAILETSGEIYQYVGDEIVVSWPKRTGIYQNNCIQCFTKIFKLLERKKDSYLERFGLVPEFKAGYHIGEVTTGEIGTIKKEIIYTGDVLNTTARIQAECNTFKAKALISEDLLEELQKEDPISYSKIGNLILRGKKEPIQLYSVSF